jgi:hypothetical protein
MMIHKLRLHDYNKSFEELAENIGDLRYDKLAKFLFLLSKKIKKDGEKDFKSGRIKLAKSLDLASEALNDSAKNIELSWDISMPFILPKDIIDKIKKEFIDENDQIEAIKILSQDWLLEDDPYFRLSRCLLFLANGNMEELRMMDKKQPYDDPRNIMLWAEYDENLNWLRDFTKPFGEENILIDENEFYDGHFQITYEFDLPFFVKYSFDSNEIPEDN